MRSSPRWPTATRGNKKPCRSNNSIRPQSRENRRMLPWPRRITLKELRRVILPFQLKKFGKLRIGSVHFAPRREIVVSEIEASAALGRSLRQLAVEFAGFANCSCAARIVRRKNHAGITLFRPGEERVAVLLDKANGSIN